QNPRTLTPPPPAPPAAELHAALRAHASDRVRALYFVTATIGGGAPHDLVGVDLAPGCSADDVIPALLAAVQPLLGKDALVDFLPLADDALAAEIRARGQRLLYGI